MDKNGKARSAQVVARKGGTKTPVAVVLRDTPPTYDWGWYSREDQRMHLQAVDKDHRHLHYKVWLEEKQRRVILPEPGIPAKVLKVLKSEIASQRGRLEAHWIEFMIKNGWLTCRLRNGLIELHAYPQSPNRFTRYLQLSELIPNAEVARKVTTRDVVLNDELAMIEIFPTRDEGSRIHHPLEDVLWKSE